ncbi:siphovirus Gp157 family protein [Mesosutterella sp. AGMB02718]|uniref:Siphovirus Gp157 family protein n=1 Tax=Mesosutterella faecium TaxID=2925194 RepID=A0ABT7ISR0_9BURK|nr:siphovirus Gp157 family protein [Mesosutterella sp. AGMB02718]MDL2060336.1 siphovirus Gp157 family protein [Mesosutterella sp. AGMB02718]MDL2060559.1 siphovirus Gp157 family protein [Mesosutterella sp. AGMB02718]
MSSLYEINDQLSAAINRLQLCFDAETGEVDDEKALAAAELELSSLQVTFNAKACAVAAFMDDSQALIEQMKDREEAIYKRRKALENRNKHLKQYLLDAMTAQGIKKVESPDFRISVAKTAPSVEIFDEAQIPDKYWVHPAPRLDKAGLRAALKEGATIPGAKLGAAGTSLRIK